MADDWHRGALIDAAGERVDLLVNNASTLGPSPQPELAGYPLDALQRVYEVNVIAPLALAQLAVPLMPAGACVINVTSDAAVEPYEGWGGYGSSKAALEQLTAILAAEQPQLRVYTVDPGDMRTQMHQEAFPGEDISDRPPPEESVPGLRRADRVLAAQRPLPRPRGPGRRKGVMTTALAFELPHALEATEPPEARGGARDAVRLMVADAAEDHITHAAFSELPEFLARRRPRRGQRVRDAARGGRGRARRRQRGPRALRHPGAQARRPLARGGAALRRWGQPGSRARGGDDHAARTRCGPRLHPARADLVAPYASGSRLMLARLDGVAGSSPIEDLLRRHGEPIRYGYVDQTLAAGGLPERLRADPGQRRDAQRRAPRSPTGSSPSSLTRGIAVAPITLHTGVSSPERHEPPFPEEYEVPEATARLVNLTRAAGGRVIAVGTTVVRALETVADADGSVTAGAGWTGLVIDPDRGVARRRRPHHRLA